MILLPLSQGEGWGEGYLGVQLRKEIIFLSSF